MINLRRTSNLQNILQLEGKYSLESTDPSESEIRAPPQLTIALKLSYYLFIIAKLFEVKDGCLKFVYITYRRTDKQTDKPTPVIT